MDARSERNLLGVHPDLTRLMRESHAKCPPSLSFIIIEGRRTLTRQKQLVADGASRTLNSRHLTGHAVDIMATINNRGRWDWPLYAQLAVLIKAEAARLSIPIIWGGDWRTFRDGPHYELSRKHYPD